MPSSRTPRAGHLPHELAATVPVGAWTIALALDLAGRLLDGPAAGRGAAFAGTAAAMTALGVAGAAAVAVLAARGAGTSRARRAYPVVSGAAALAQLAALVPRLAALPAVPVAVSLLTAGALAALLVGRYLCAAVPADGSGVDPAEQHDRAGGHLQRPLGR